MSRIMKAWEQVLRDAITSDYDEQQFALLQIGMVLQRHNPHRMMESDAEEEALTRELLRLTLSPERQTDTVLYLAELARKKVTHADIFLYAMSNAQPRILVEPLLQLLIDIGANLKPDAIFQVLLALDSLIRHSDAHIQQTFITHDIIDLLDDWAELDDTIIADKADRIADKILDLTDEDDEEGDS
ncbi:MAG: hypothetical protein ACFE0Q_07360 [Anaerolineae bacterium]